MSQNLAELSLEELAKVIERAQKATKLIAVADVHQTADEVAPLRPCQRCIFSRKRNAGSVAGTVAGLFVPLGALSQLVGERLSVDCSVKPGVDGVHQMVAKPGAALVMWSVGAPGVCTSVCNAQKPPVSEYWPLVIGPPASCWPMVPLTE